MIDNGHHKQIKLIMKLLSIVVKITYILLVNDPVQKLIGNDGKKAGSEANKKV